MPRYAKRSPSGVELFCDALSPMTLSRRDDTVEFDTRTIMPLFEKLADLETADAAGGTQAITIERDRLLSLVSEVASANLKRYCKENNIVTRIYKADQINVARRFCLKRKKGLLDEAAWDSVIKAYIGSPEYNHVTQRA